MNTLENEKLLIEISDHGAELSRIYRKDTKKECLWDADPTFWNRHAPVLFPIVGALEQEKYRYNGNAYSMKQHGFARDLEFKMVKATPNQIVHQLNSSEETRKNYPFDFKLTITHCLEGDTIMVKWNVENTGNQEMYFNIGAHPAFLVGENSSLRFPEKTSLDYIRINAPGTALPGKHVLNLEDGNISMPKNFFDEGVYIFEDGQVEEVQIYDAEGKRTVTLQCPGFPYVGVWSKPGAPFVCLEPWQGRTDDAGFAGEISQKAGIKKLLPGEVFETSYQMCF